MCRTNPNSGQGKQGYAGRGRSTDGHGQSGYWHKFTAVLHHLNPLTWIGAWDGLKGGY